MPPRKSEPRGPEFVPRTKISSEDLPRRTLEEALRVAQIIRDTYAGKATSWEEIAGALGVSPKNPPNRYPLWSATAYGIIIKHGDNTYSLAETGRKILAPTYEGEKEEGVKKALFTPSVLSRFYTDYNGATLPSDDLFPNVLENRYEIPRERTGEVIAIIKKNALFAGAILESDDGKLQLRFSDTAFPLSTEATVRPGGDGAEVREGVKPEVSPVFDRSFEKACFVITPLGAEDSNERKHADTVLRHLIEPVLKETNIVAIRADQICVTKANKDEPWLNFEAGALAKQLKGEKPNESRVCPLLIDMTANDVTGALKLLQGVPLDKGGVTRILQKRSTSTACQVHSLKTI